MSINRAPLLTLGYGLILVIALSFGELVAHSRAAARPGNATAEADQEVLKINEECNTAELKGDVAVMDRCETDGFTHIHENGVIERKADYLKGVGSGAHKFLALDLSDVHVRSYGTTAIVEEHLHLRADMSGKINDVNHLVIVVWTKQQGKWLEATWIALGLPGSEAAAPGKN
jgi:hypothetical protein